MISIEIILFFIECFHLGHSLKCAHAHTHTHTHTHTLYITVFYPRTGFSLKTQPSPLYPLLSFLFVSAYSPFIMMLSIIWYLLLPRTVIGIFGSLILSKVLMEVIFNTCGECRWSPEGPLSQLHSPHLLAGAPGIFSDLLRSLGMLKREWGAESNGKLPHLSMLSTTAAWGPEFAVENLLWAELRPWFLSLQRKTCPCAEYSDDFYIYIYIYIGLGKASKSCRTYLSLVKLQPWFLSSEWKRSLWAELQPWFLSFAVKDLTSGFRRKGFSANLAPRYRGPLKILEFLIPVTVLLRDPQDGSVMKAHVGNLKNM